LVETQKTKNLKKGDVIMEAVKNVWTLKNELKQLASELRNDKAEIKKIQKNPPRETTLCADGLIYCAGGLQYKILRKRKTYRHKHIAYCLIRGRSYEQIEQHCRKGNEPDQNLIQELIREYRTDNVCACA
jgi:hypothetical protein